HISATPPPAPQLCHPRTRRPPRPPLFPYTTLFRSPRLGPRVAPQLVALAPEHPGLGLRGEPVKLVQRANRQLEGALDRRNRVRRAEEHTSELQSPYDLVCRLLLEKKKHETKAERTG